MSYQYQTFDDAPGMVDSYAKLRALRLPPLAGRSFLDVGCNEGYYCGVALKAGARRVVGLDGFAEVIERARSRFPGAEFVLQSWDNLPAEQFDVVLYASCMHYLPRQADVVAMLRRLGRCLAPGGVLIVEAGVIDDAAVAEMREVKRSDATVHYPTASLIPSLFDEAGLTWRPVGRSTEGDGIRRSVFHCQVRQPCVLFVRGEPGAGKSYLTRALVGAGGERVVHLDYLCARLFAECYPGETLDTSLASYATELVRRDGVRGASLIADAVVQEIDLRAPAAGDVREDAGIIIEGLSPLRGEDVLTFETAKEALQKRQFVVWDATPISKPPPNRWLEAGAYVDCGGYLLLRNDRAKGAVKRAVLSDTELMIQGTIDEAHTGTLTRAIVCDDARGASVETDVWEFGGEWVATVPLAAFTGLHIDVGNPASLSEQRVYVILLHSDHTASFPDRPSTGPDWPFLVGASIAKSSV